MMPPRAVQERRDEEFANARTAYEVDKLQQKWLAEDQALVEAHGFAAQEMASLREENRSLHRRLAALEKLLGPKGRKWTAHWVKVLGDVIRLYVGEQLEQRGLLSYKGVWDQGQVYKTGSLITHSGSAWIAVAPCAAGEQPGKAAGWRLAIKASSQKEPGIA